MDSKHYLLIEVDGDPGLDCISLNRVDWGTIEEITPILLKIYDNDGWFPTGDFLYPAIIGPTPWKEYGEGNEEAFQTLLSLMPNPESGFRRITRVFSWQEKDVMSLIM